MSLAQVSIRWPGTSPPAWRDMPIITTPRLLSGAFPATRSERLPKDRGTPVTGTSPPAWIGPHRPYPRPRLLRRISACAKRTASTSARTCCGTAHLRWRGADVEALQVQSGGNGTSPQARSGLGEYAVGETQRRNISACAERTAGECSGCQRRTEHLRVCGADITDTCRAALRTGTSPPARSGPFAACAFVGSLLCRYQGACGSVPGAAVWHRLDCSR